MRPTLPLRPRCGGFSIPELMISVAVGLLILAAMSTLFATSNSVQTKIERSNRQVENGRYAVDLLSADLRNAGYFAEFDPTLLPTPAKLPDACAVDLDTIKLAMPLHVQGRNYDANFTAPSCIGEARANSDVLVVRHARACVRELNGACNTNDADGPLFQASLCNLIEELNSPDITNHYALETDSKKLTRHKRNCSKAAGSATISGDLADTRRYVTHIYFVADNDNPNDKIPTLKRAELRLVDGNLKFVIVPLVEYVESLQLEYGIDKDGNGSIDEYTSAPADTAAWRNVLAARIAVVASNGETETTKKKMQTFQSLLTLPNPSGRRQP